MSTVQLQHKLQLHVREKDHTYCVLNKDHTISFPTAATCTVNESVAAPRKSVTVFVKYTPVTGSLPLTYYIHYCIRFFFSR